MEKEVIKLSLSMHAHMQHASISFAYKIVFLLVSDVQRLLNQQKEVVKSHGLRCPVFIDLLS